tara:strand:+ start:79 stop:435 length:357 start_codon:yes stop_codon:yes gene_type:complete
MKKPNKSNHYAVVKFSPKLNTDTTLFLFEHGRFFSDEDMSDYILWFMEHQGLSIDDVKLRVSYEECRGILDRDQYVDWNNVSRPYFKHLAAAGAFHPTYYKQETGNESPQRRRYLREV